MVLTKKYTTNLLSYIFFFVMLLLSILLAKERIMITDPAYYFFNIVNKADFFIPHTRDTAVINQFPLVIATKLHVPLTILLPLYSASFVFVRILYFYLVNNVLKNKAAGFAIIAVTAIGVAESYFRPTSESHLALFNSILLYAWLCYSKDNQKWGRWKTYINLIIIAFFVLFGYVSHSIALFSLLFVIIYFTLEHKKFKSFEPYFALTFTLVVFMYHIFIGNDDPGHESIYGNLMASPLAILEALKTYYPYKYFSRNFIAVFLPYGFLFAYNIGLQISRKKWLPLAFTIVYSVFYFIAACTSFKEGDSNMQMEKIFLPLTLFAALPLFETIKGFNANKKIFFSAVAIMIVIFGLTKIYKASSIYKKRIDTIQNVFIKKADLQKNRKLVIDSDEISKYNRMGSWAFGIETFVLSTLDKEIEPLTIYIDTKSSDISEKMNDPDNFMPATFQTSFNYKSFNSYYFTLPEQKYIRWKME